MRRVAIYLLAMALAELALGSPARADPALPLRVLPVCGDQDGTPPLVTHCSTLTLAANVQTYRVPGSGPVDLRFDFVFREAAFNNELGFFRVDDTSGSIGEVGVGSPGYLSVAFDRAQIIFRSGSTAITPDAVFRFNGGDILVFFIVQNSTFPNLRSFNPTNQATRLPLAFFSIDRLNPDGIDHFVGFEDSAGGFSQFGFEDLTGGGDLDFDDVVYNVFAPLQAPAVRAVERLFVRPTTGDRTQSFAQHPAPQGIDIQDNRNRPATGTAPGCIRESGSAFPDGNWTGDGRCDDWKGAPVVAAAPGRVITAREMEFGANGVPHVVEVDHGTVRGNPGLPDGTRVRTRYLHLGSKDRIDQVAGQPRQSFIAVPDPRTAAEPVCVTGSDSVIGFQGFSGNTTATHLHYEVILTLPTGGEERQDPEDWGARRPEEPRRVRIVPPDGCLGPPPVRVLAGATVALPVSVPSGQARIILLTSWTGSDIVMTLRTPSGRVIGRSTVAGDIIHEQGAAFESYTIISPEPGNWQVALFGADVPLGGEDVDFGVTKIAETVPPTTAASVSPSPNANGWNTTNVTVSLSAADNPGGSGVKEITYAASGAHTIASTVVPGGLATANITAEGETTITYFARDNAGNTEAARTVIVRVDKTPPIITGSRSPAPNAAGWNNTDVTVNFLCNDGLSGVDSCGPTPQTISSEGRGQSRTATARDKAGNEVTGTVGNINIDKTPPTVSCNTNPSSLWPPNHEMVPVTATVNVADAVSVEAGFTLVSALSSEPDDGLGDGDTPNDIQGFVIGTPDTSGELRAERSGTGPGRAYTLTYRGIDSAGNAATCNAVTSVPHEQRR